MWQRDTSLYAPIVFVDPTEKSRLGLQKLVSFSFCLKFELGDYKWI